MDRIAAFVVGSAPRSLAIGAVPFAAIYRWLGPWAVLALFAYGFADTAVCAWLVLWRRAA